MERMVTVASTVRIPMLRVLLALGMLCPVSVAYAQLGITPDGRYAFTVEDKSAGQRGQTLVVKATGSAWRKEVKGGSQAAFSRDGKHLVYRDGETVKWLRLGTDDRTDLGKGGAYRLAPDGRHGWLAMQGDDAEKTLLLRNLQTGKSRRLTGVSSYALSNHGALAFLAQPDDGGVSTLSWLDLNDAEPVRIWSAGNTQVKHLAFDASGQRLAFVASGPEGNSLWSFRRGADEAVCLARDGMAAFGDSLTIRTEPTVSSAGSASTPFLFSEGGGKILFYAQEKPRPQPAAGAVTVWSYTDVKPMDWQVRDAGISLKFAFVADVQTTELLRLEQANEKLAAGYGLGISDPQWTDGYALVIGFPAEAFTYSRSADATIIDGYSILDGATAWLVSLRDGTRKRIFNDAGAIGHQIMLPYYRFSPDGRSILFFDRKDFYGYDIATGETTALTKGLPVDFAQDSQTGMGYFNLAGVVGWVGQEALVKDVHEDVWRMDLGGKRAPVCLTRGFFRKLAQAEVGRLRLAVSPVNGGAPFTDGEQIVCKVTSDRFMSHGFYAIGPDRAADPKVLVPLGGPDRIDAFQKAAHAERYILQRESAASAPLTYVTRDFMRFEPLTGSEMDRRPPGIGKEVLRWTMPDGRMAQGLLIKPRDLDPAKKYPLIMIYYEVELVAHNRYETYGLGHLVDHGYLVFLPDIPFRIGEFGKSVVNAVVSAADLLAQRPEVDADRMGLFGGSFGGLQTNYLVTQTDRFAAAISISGYSDLIANKGMVDIGRRPHEAHRGTGQNRQGATLWERPDIYLASSPIFFADRVTTPLLLIHGSKDDNVPFEQSVAFFRALRSLGKRAWLLQYNEMGHNGVTSAHIGNEADGFDFTIRRLQFFNHYLKGAPAPKWMLEGVPYRLKGQVNDLELDTTGRTPGPGLQWLDGYERTPAQQELLKKRTRVTAEGRVEDVEDAYEK